MGVGSGNWRGGTVRGTAVRGRGGARGRQRGSSTAHVAGFVRHGSVGVHGSGDAGQFVAKRGRPRGRPRTKGVLSDGVMDQRSPEL